MSTPGHTPGHTSYLVTDGTDSVMVLGDLTSRPEINLRNPGWHVIFDMDAPAAEATRRRVLDRLAAEGTRAVGYHWNFPAIGRVVREGEGYRVAPEWRLANGLTASTRQLLPAQLARSAQGAGKQRGAGGSKSLGEGESPIRVGRRRNAMRPRAWLRAR